MEGGLRCRCRNCITSAGAVQRCEGRGPSLVLTGRCRGERSGGSDGWRERRGERTSSLWLTHFIPPIMSGVHPPLLFRHAHKRTDTTIHTYTQILSCYRISSLTVNPPLLRAGAKCSNVFEYVQLNCSCIGTHLICYKCLLGHSINMWFVILN